MINPQWLELRMSITNFYRPRDVRAEVRLKYCVPLTEDTQDRLQLRITKIENFTTKKWKLSENKIWFFSYFCSKHRLWVLNCGSKHRLWVLVRIASSSMFLSRNKKINVYSCKPQICWGLRGSKLYRPVFVIGQYKSALLRQETEHTH